MAPEKGRKQVKREMTVARERLEAELQEAEEELQELERRLNDRPKFGLGEGSTLSDKF